MAASFDDLSDALRAIPSDLPRDDWWKIAAALKNELGEDGFDLFDQWSRNADSYKSIDARATWKSTKDSGGITIATLFGMARDHGHRPRQKAQKATTARRKARSKPAASSAAQTYWDCAEDCTSHPYAERKGHDTAGLKKYKGCLLIPAYNAAGKMSSLQEISKDGDKKFLKGCTMSGCWYTLPGDDVVVVAEGWATAKSIHAATGHTCVVAFSSSGFQKVPPLLRKKYPTARIILAPDNDESQDAVKKATLAARDCQCELIVPVIADGSDFNDLHLAAGLDEVRRQFAENVYTPRLHDLVLVNAADVAPEPVEWLWPGKFALGKLVLLGGLPSTGKTTITHSIIAIVTTGGKWPFSGHQAERGRCVILTAEDDIADTVIPRLMAAGADCAMVEVLESPLLLARDMDQLDGLLRQQPDIRLIVLDPLSAYLGAKDSHRETDVREILLPVAHLAARHRVCILGIAHLNKREGSSAMTRFMGSGAIIQASRSAYMTVRVDGHLMLLPVKNNLARREDASGLSYSIIGATVGDGIHTSTIEWTGEVDMWADEAMAQEAEASRAPKLMEAREFLADFLASGPKPQQEIETAAREKGIAWRTVRRAKKELGYVSHKDRFTASWKWYSDSQWENYQKVLAKGAKPAEKEANEATLGHLREPEEKPLDPQQQIIGHLRGKTGVATPPKTAPDKALHEDGQGIVEKPQDGQPKTAEKEAESTKVATSRVLGNVRFDDDVVLL